MGSLTDDELQKLFTWVDTIPLSRAKRNINRDFSDGVLAAEVIAHYFPRLVDMHNYPASSNSAQKLANWRTLNTKVLKKIKHAQAPLMLEELVHAKVGAAEVFLHSLQYKLARYKAEKSSSSSSSNNNNNNSNSSIIRTNDDVQHHQLPTAGRFSPLMASPLEGRFAAATASSSSPSSPASPSSLARRPGDAHIHSSFASMQSPIPSSSLFSDAAAGGGMDVLRQQQSASGPLGSVRSPGRLRREEQVSVDEEILLEKEETLQELREVRRGEGGKEGEEEDGVESMTSEHNIPLSASENSPFPPSLPPSP